MLARLVLCIGHGTLSIQIEVFMIHRRLQRIVKMGGSMPHSIRFGDTHVIHLYGKEFIEGRVPRVLVHIAGNLHCRSTPVTIFYDVQPAIRLRCEVEGGVGVSEILAPHLRRRSEYFCFFPVSGDLEQSGHREETVGFVELDNCNLLLIGVIASLRICDHRRTRPLRDCTGSQGPFDHRTDSLGWQNRANHEPSVLGFIASVIQHQFPGLRLYRNMPCGILGCKIKRAPGSDGVWLDKPRG